MSPVHAYLTALHQARGTRSASPERSLYGAFQALVNEIGKGLKPKVFCVQELADAGAGRPDFGLFVVSQLSFDDLGAPSPMAPLPERGVVEAKAPAIPLDQIVGSRQVADYWERYGLVLVTNFRAFAVLGKDAGGRLKEYERFILADTEDQFWGYAAHPGTLPKEKEQRLLEFLRRALLYNVSLSQPRDVAAFLASFARDCLALLESAASLSLDNPDRRFDRLALVRESLEASLGIKFDTKKGLHFFHSTLVQTLFYGLFSAWVIWHRTPADKRTLATFSAYGAAWHMKLPVLRSLFEQVYNPGVLDGLGVPQILDTAAQVLNRVDGRAFFTRFHQDHAVQYFYEPFLEAFDPELRKQLGVWYTPPEVVDYMVERVDRALRDELGIELGLADERVHVLDPCCGTGSFILAVLDRIGRTIGADGTDALKGEMVKRAAMERVHGFEIMPAPFVVAHLQVALMLQQRFGAPLDSANTGHTRNRDEWASIVLTNALTGGDERYDHPVTLPMPDLQAEMREADRLKRDTRVWVVIGNPPYNGYAGVGDTREERELTSVYRQVRHVRPPEGQGLNDLYVRFWRMAERRIAEQSGFGVVCLITNYSWLDGLSFTGMRERLLKSFDGIWIDCLNGDKFKTGKRTPDGLPDPSIFSTEQNREGIGVGTAIGLMVRHERHPSLEPGPATLRFRHFWGADKRDRLKELAEALASGEPVEPGYVPVVPALALGLPYFPANANAGYSAWPALPDLIPVSFPGVKTSRDDFLVDIDRDRLEARIRDYFNKELSDADIAERYPGVMEEQARYKPKTVRRHLLGRTSDSGIIVPYSYRPYDNRWLYWEPETKLLDEKREEFFDSRVSGALAIEAREKQSKEDFDRGYVVAHLADNFGSGLSSFFPSRYAPRPDGTLLAHGTNATIRENLSAAAQAYLSALSLSPPITPAEVGAQGLQQELVDTGRAKAIGNAPPILHISTAFAGAAPGGTPTTSAQDNFLFLHTVAVMNTPAYRQDNGAALRQGWPRIPLPATAERLEASVALGRRVADLLEPGTPVRGVTLPPERPGLARLAVFRAVHLLDDAPPPTDWDGTPEPARPDYRVTAGWGHAGQNGVCMPGRGDARAREWSAEERAALIDEGAALGLAEGEVFRLLGGHCLDVHLNPTTCWAAVPERVWAYTIGGYQVVKKWLSYREHKLLGRPLKPDEALHVQGMVRRIAALILMGPELDANYRACAADPYVLPRLNVAC
ncbi:MAG TPA: type ISP restriction/modification enzyme [Azospirillaceae bacterium]|nr:type ISP restriction/modification enzyme [Azospirillaceae bacterium]